MPDRRAADALRSQILSFLENHPDRAYRAKEISRALQIKNQGRYQALLEAFDSIRDSGDAAGIRGGRLQHRGNESEAVGRLSVTAQGFGFVEAEDGTEYFIRARRMRTALDGDRVRIALAADTRNRPSDMKREAEVIEVIERGRQRTVGTFSVTGKSGWVAPDDNRLTHDVFVPRDGWSGATPGDKVVVTIDVFDDPRASPEGTIVDVLGPADAPGVDVLALAMAHGAPSDFPEEVEAYASKITDGITKTEIGRRLDLRDAPVFTIDPEDAKDFDDAIHTRDLGDGLIQVGVHIADVSHYVRSGDAIDQEALDRATSTYLVDRVIPMLPEVLSNGVCSLRPREDKLAYSCILTVDGGGNVHRWEIRETVIHSKERFTYDSAQAVLDGRDHPLADEIRRAGTLARTLTKKRMADGAIDFDVPEVRVQLDAEGQPVAIYEKERKAANRLIEEFMLLANQAVAMEASKREVPFVYRIHAPPDRQRIASLADYVKTFGYSLPHQHGDVRRDDLNRLLRKVKGTPEAPVIEQASIRSMSKAIYSPDNVGHYGLGFEHYAHFTSPIRRYPDLIAHRVLKRVLGQQSGALPTEETLESQAKHCSEREREAAEAERESVRLKQVEYAAQHLGDIFDGVVVGVTRFGVFVQMRPILVEGLVHVREMAGDYWEYDERRYVLVGKNTGRRIRVGDPCRVRIDAADPETRRVDLAFEEPPGRIVGSDRQRSKSKAKQRRQKRTTRGTKRRRR